MKNNLKKYFSEGQIVKIFWKDTTVTDRIPASRINDELLAIEDTISVGMLLKWNDTTILLASEYSNDQVADACSVETIPIGMIEVIEGMERVTRIKVNKEFTLKDVTGKYKKISKRRYHKRKYVKRKPKVNNKYQKGKPENLSRA